MKIISPAFEHNKSIPSKYTCAGENINPPLEFSDVPESARSLALIMHDPDAPRENGFTHWVVWNINPSITDFKENSVPEDAIQGPNGRGENSYTGPCPPSGTHRYFFKLYALDIKLDLTPDTDKSGLEKAMEGHILAQAELIGLYSRK